MQSALSTGKGWLAAAATAAISAGHPAYAEIVHFVNAAPGHSGHYDWHWPLFGEVTWLDVTLGPSHQSNSANGNSVAQFSYLLFAQGGNINATVGGAGVLTDGQTRALLYGAVIQGNFSGISNHAELFNDRVVTNFAERETLFMGVRTHEDKYGWIEVVRIGMNFTAHAWAYENEPGTPIHAGQIPAPGSVALLALSSVIGPLRKRKSL